MLVSPLPEVALFAVVLFVTVLPAAVLLLAAALFPCVLLDDTPLLAAVLFPELFPVVRRKKS